MKAALEKHLFIPDLQIPDHNKLALKLLYKFIPDFVPDVAHIMGDVVNFTKASKYEQPRGYDTTLNDEIEMGRIILKEIITKLRLANPKVKINYFEGNHEDRLNRYLMRNADQVAGITDENDQPIVSVPHLFNLKEQGINWIPYTEIERVHNFIVEHGDISRSKGGYTAHAMLDKRGMSGFSGHTHRLSFITRNQAGIEKFWIECGSLCNSNPIPRYVKKPDWQNGFVVGQFDLKEKTMHPTVIMIQNNQFVYGSKVYRA